MSGPERLAAAVFGRRSELGLTRDQVRERGGPSEPTLRSIESKPAVGLVAMTLTKLDTALDWEPGSAARVLDGGEPEPRAQADIVRPFAAGPNEIVIGIPVVLELLAVSGDLDRLAREHKQHSDLGSVTDRLHRALHPIYGRYVTRLFEENRRTNGTLSPIFAIFSRLLDEPNESEDAREFEERQYRRWLAGRDDALHATDVNRFQHRFEESE